MPAHRFKDALFTEADQVAIRKLASKMPIGGNASEFIGPGESPELTRELVSKLSSVGAVKDRKGTRDGRAFVTFTDLLLTMIAEFDEANSAPVDYWDEWTKRLRSKKWSLPLFVVAAGLPLLFSYIQMAVYVFNYLFGVPNDT